MNHLAPPLSSGTAKPDGAASGWPAMEYPASPGARTGGYAAWILAMFLVGTIVDYGGGLFVKQSVFLLALVYIVGHKRTHELWFRCLPDIAIVLLVPAAITLVQMCFSTGAGPDILLAELWRRLGSPSYYLLFPLIYIVGAQRTARWLVLILSMIALATLLVVVAHTAGLIDITRYSEFVMSRRLALFGTDIRAHDLGVADIGLPGFGAAQAFPSGFALALALQPAGAFILGLSTFLGTQRGQVLGIVLVCGITLVQYRSLIAARCAQILGRPLKVFVPLAVVLVVLATGFAAFYYLGDLLTLLFYKYQLLLSGQDESSSTRFGHVAGYMQAIGASPSGILWGFAPPSSIYNTILGEQIVMTEMVVIMYLLWYGWIYTLLFYLWIGRELLQLKRRSRSRFDWALLTACAVLVVIGNINPVMLTPLAFVFLALLRARLLESEREVCR